MKKILHIITGLDVGGAEFTLLQLLSNIDKERFDCYVINLTDHKALIPQFHAQGIRVYNFDFQIKLGSLFQLLNLVRLIHKINPDLVHTWMYHADLIGGIASRLAGVRRLLWGIHHSNLDVDKNSRVTLYIVRICAWLSGVLPTRISVCSRVALDSHLHFGYRNPIDHYAVIPNGFNLALFKPDAIARRNIRSELEIPDDAVLFGMMARYHPQKDHPGFLQAALNIIARFPNVYFVLCGTGVDENNSVLQKYLSGTEWRQRIFLLGYRSDVSQIYAALDVHMLCSHGEAFPNVLGEAMASGVPCIAAEVGDCREIIGDTGLIYPAGNVPEIIACMLKMLVSDRSELGRRARQRIDEHYTLDKMVDRYQSLYDKLIGIP